jgi:hypothetical protein
MKQEKTESERSLVLNFAELMGFEPFEEVYFIYFLFMIYEGII